MISTREGEVVAVRRSWRGAVDLAVLVDGASRRALAFPALVGLPEAGDRVLLNSTAVDLGLGTGGYHLVIAVDGKAPTPDREGGHVIKARYTPLQAAWPVVDEPDSPHRTAMDACTDLGGTPVVVCDLHSALPAVVAGVLRDRPQARIAYVMTDGGALPLWLSRTVAGLREADWLCGSITCGQSFGGDLEAVTLHSGLIAAVAVLGADAVVVSQGPGNAGVASTWGFSGIAVGDAINAVSTLNGAPIAALRISLADQRQRHRGVSHHSRTALGRVALVPADVVIPGGMPADLAGIVSDDLADSGIAARHRLVTVAVDRLEGALRSCPVPLSSMGRGFDDDRWHFLASAAAGRHAASLIA